MELNIKLHGLKYNYEKVQGYFCKISRFQRFLGFIKLFSLRKIRTICPQHRGPDPPSPTHGPMDFIKRQLLVSGLTAQIESSESVSLLGCLDPIGRWVAIGSSQPMQESPSVDPMAEAAGSGRGWHRFTLAAVRHGRVRRLTGVRVFSSYGGRFSMRFTPMESKR
jgi:hypothetical protein